MAYLRNKKDFETGFLLKRSLSFKGYIRRKSPLFSFETVQKIYDLHLRLRFMLETRVRCTKFVARQS